MRIVHTFLFDKMANSLAGGWPDTKNHIASWALSMLLAKKHYGNVHLVTNQLGHEILIDALRLPYDSVKLVNVEKFKNFPKSLWSHYKVYSYSLQEQPFFHIDGDVFLFKNLGSKFARSPLVAQNIEVNFNFYLKSLFEIDEHFNYVPDYFADYIDSKNAVVTSSAGIIGGTSIDFFSSYYQECRNLILKNIDKLNNINLSYFNYVIEQFLFSALSWKSGYEISYVLPSFDYFAEPDFKKGVKEGFMHINGSKRQSIKTCETILELLHVYFPQYYERLNENI